MFQLQTPSYKKLRLWNLEYSCFTLIDSYINLWRLSQIELLIESQTWTRNKVIFSKLVFHQNSDFFLFSRSHWEPPSVRYWKRCRVVSIKTRYVLLIYDSIRLTWILSLEWELRKKMKEKKVIRKFWENFF